MQGVGGGLGVGVDDGLAGGGGDPHQQVDLPVGPGVAGVVGRELGLAHPAHPGQDLADHGGAPALHGGAQAVHLGPVLERTGPAGDHPDLVRPGDGRPGRGSGLVGDVVDAVRRQAALDGLDPHTADGRWAVGKA